MKIEIKIPKIYFEPQFASLGKIATTAETALNRVKREHEKKFKAAKEPDGSPMPPLSPGYKKEKASIRPGTTPKRDLILHSKMLSSSNVEQIREGTKAGAGYGFAGTETKKAYENEQIIKRKGGKGFHYLSDSDDTLIEKTFNLFLEKEITNLVKIDRTR